MRRKPISLSFCKNVQSHILRASVAGRRKGFIYIFNFLRYIDSFNNLFLSCCFTIVASSSPFYCLFVTWSMHLLWTMQYICHSKASPKHFFSIFSYYLNFGCFFFLFLSLIAKGSVFWFSFYYFCKDIECITVIASECFWEPFETGPVHRSGSN